MSTSRLKYIHLPIAVLAACFAVLMLLCSCGVSEKPDTQSDTNGTAAADTNSVNPSATVSQADTQATDNTDKAVPDESETLPESNDNTEPDGAENINPDEQEEEEVMAVSAAVLLPSSEDDFVIFNGYYFLNISDNPEFADYEYYIGDYFGQVSSNVSEDNISLDNDGLASVLPIGTKLYKYPDYPAIILADTDGILIPYLKMVEG